MFKLFDAPPGFRFLVDGDTIQAGDIVYNDFGEPCFKIGLAHWEIGNAWDASCMPMIRPV